MGSGESEERSVIRRAISCLEVPLDVLLHLASIGVCARCLFRLFGCQEPIYSCSILTDFVLHSMVEEVNGSSHDSHKIGHSLESSSSITEEAESNREFCIICLGILQFSVLGGSCTNNTLDNFVKEVARVVKKEGYQIDGFSIEIFVPKVIVFNERSLWFHLKEKYGSQDWMRETFHRCISVKEALKLSITTSLQNQLAVNIGTCPFLIRLCYDHLIASQKIQALLAKDEGLKKRKLDFEHQNGLQHSKIESDATIKKLLESLDDQSFSLCFGSPPAKVNAPCNLTIICYRTPIYIGGRYLKFSRKVSQSRWIIDDERMGEASVEEIIGSNTLAVCKGDSYRFHAAGREDIDVRMLGSGRPFLVEVSNPRLLPSSINPEEISNIIGQLEHKYVSLRSIKVLGSEAWDLMREGEAEKQKEYAALVWTSHPLSETHLEKICSTRELEILQRTPIRVLHRRSPLERNRTIHWMKIERVCNSGQYFLLHLCTQAGTYIKEFVHGDFGRTHPSLGSILGCRTEILQLDVTDVKMDNFL